MKTSFVWNGKGVIEILNKTKAQEALERKALLAQQIALRQWEIVNRGQSTEPEVYARSFGIRTRERRGIKNRQMYNSDSRWFFVEFGVNSGPGRPGYKYRIFGHTLDVLASGV